MTTTSINRGWTMQRKRIVRRALRSDPGQEYYVYVPSGGGQGAPIFISVHGISRNAREQARLFSTHAEHHGAVLIAPHFTAERHPDYQRLGRVGHGLRADAALNAIIEEVSLSTGASAGQVYLFGYSGGAQFAHRYMMAYPHRVARCVVASAGWYTFPDVKRRFPYGLRPNKGLPGVQFDPEEFLLIPVTVLVGEHDTTNGGLRRGKRIDQQQGETRVERALNWVEAMRVAAATFQMPPLVAFDTLGNGGHSFRYLMKNCQLGEKVFKSLFEWSTEVSASESHGS